MNRIKYPRTSHLPWSLGLTNGDKKLIDVKHFYEKEIIMSQKMDGECTTMAKEYYHARSVDPSDHPSRHYVKGIWGSIQYKIPEGMRIVGENMYAKHSIFYDNLLSYFLVHSIWISDICLSYKQTENICHELGLNLCPVYYCGVFDVNVIGYIQDTIDFEQVEGYVLRRSDAFFHDRFELNVNKYVRKNHVQTSEHWMNEKIIQNGLCTDLTSYGPPF